MIYGMTIKTKQVGEDVVRISSWELAGDKWTYRGDDGKGLKYRLDNMPAKGIIYAYNLDKVDASIIDLLGAENVTTKAGKGGTYQIEYKGIAIRDAKKKTAGATLKEMESEEWGSTRTGAGAIQEIMTAMHTEGYTHTTTSSDAWHDYIKGHRYYKKDFPVLNSNAYEFIRRSYHGGWCYCKEAGDYSEGYVLDVNSLYPYVMLKRSFPVGHGKLIKGKPAEFRAYKAYIMKVLVVATLKEGHPPTLQRSIPHMTTPEPVIDTEGLEEFILTHVDYCLMKQHYDIYDLMFVEYYEFNTKKGEVLFGDYIEKHYNGKINSTGSKKKTHKLMMNGLAGKFATRRDVDSIDAYGNHKSNYNDIVGYIPVAAFITSYAREYTITAAMQNWDRFIYSDTDSIHLKGNAPAVGVEVGDALGEWKVEFTFDRARYIAKKTYILANGSDYKCTCSGLEKTIKDRLIEAVGFDGFKSGVTIRNGGYNRRRVQGGYIFEISPFTIGGLVI